MHSSTNLHTISTLLGTVIIAELEAIREMENRKGLNAIQLLEVNHQVENARERHALLSRMRDQADFLAAGFNGVPCCGTCQQEAVTGGPENFVDAMIKDILGSGVSITKINLEDMFKDKVPSENKAQAAAQAAGERSSGQTGGLRG